MRRASQRIAIIRPVVIIFFSISSMGTAIGQDELEGYRLFFTEEERSDKGPSNTALSDPDVVAGTLPEPQPRLSAASAASAARNARNASTSSRARRASSASTKGSVNDVNVPTVFFDAVLSSRSGIQLLINGLPCHVADFTDSSAAASTVHRADHITCKHVQAQHFQLRWLTASSAVEVKDKQGLIRTLLPGQGL